jgi:hypothetical protein
MHLQKFRQPRMILQRAMDYSSTTVRFITLQGPRTISFGGCCEMAGRQSIPRSLWRIKWCSCFWYVSSGRQRLEGVPPLPSMVWRCLRKAWTTMKTISSCMVKSNHPRALPPYCRVCKWLERWLDR